jgi:hypothetical protein
MRIAKSGFHSITEILSPSVIYFQALALLLYEILCLLKMYILNNAFCINCEFQSLCSGTYYVIM